MPDREFRTKGRAYLVEEVEEVQRGPNPLLIFLIIVAVLLSILVVMYWKAILMVLLAISGMALAVWGTIRLVQKGHLRWAFAPIPATLLMLVLASYLVSKPSTTPTNPPTLVPTPMKIPLYFTSTGPITVEGALQGQSQGPIYLELKGTDIVKVELEATGVYQVPFQLFVLDPSGVIIGSSVGTIIPPWGFQASVGGRYSLMVRNTSGDFRSYRLTYTTYSGG